MTHETHVKTRKSLIIKCMYRGHHVYKFLCSSAAYFMSYQHFCSTLFLFSVSIRLVRFAHFLAGPVCAMLGPSATLYTGTPWIDGSLVSTYTF